MYGEKQKYFHIVWIYIILILFCLAAFFTEKKQQIWHQSMDMSIEAYTTGSIGGEIKLHPGIYRMKVKYQLNTEELIGACCFVKGEPKFLCTGIPLYDGLTETEGIFYLTDFADDLQIDISVVNAEVRIVEITVENTGKLWTVFIAVLTFFLFMVLGIVCFLDANRKGKISKEKKISGLILVGIWLLASLPNLYNKTLIGADGGYHMQRIEGVAAALLLGQIPVRIEPHWLQGYGYANGVFYCDLFLIIPALLRIIGFTVTTSYNIYCVVVNAAITIVSFIAFHGVFKNKKIALSCCALYSLSAFRFYKMIYTGTIGEGTALIFLPLILLGIYKIFEETKCSEKNSFLPLTFGFSGVICCHILSTEISFLFIIIWCIANIRQLKKKNVRVNLYKAGLSAFLLCMWFIVPFADYYLTQDIHVKHAFAREIQNEGLHLSQMFLFYWRIENSADPVGVDFILSIGLVVFLVLQIYNFARRKIIDSDSGIFEFGKKCSIFSIMFMVMSLRVFPWNRIQGLGGIVQGLVSSIQFPERFLGWGICLAVAVYGCLLKYFEKKGYIYAFKICVVLGVFYAATSALCMTESYMSSVENVFLSNAEGMGSGYISGGEYLIEGTDADLLHYGKVASGDGIILEEMKKSALSGEISVKNPGEKESWVELPLLYYKGYCAKTGGGEKVAVSSGNNHVVRVTIFAGYEGKIRVYFRSPLLWRLSELISLFSVFVLFFIGAGKNFMKKFTSNNKS